MQASPAPNETRLPRAVLRRSAAIQARLDAEREPKTDPVDPSAPPAQPSTQATPPVEPKPNNAAPVTATDPRDSDPEYWKQRFRVVEGRLKAREQEHRDAVGGLHQQISELTEQVRTLQANAPAQPTDIGEFLTPEQVEMLGEQEAQTIVETVLKAARKEVKTLVDAELKPLRDANTRQRADTQQDLKQRFLDQLTELVPDYEVVDATDGWKLWLADEDESTEVVRQTILDTHIGKANAAGVAKMFKAYKATLHQIPAPPVAPNGTGAGPSGSPPANQPSALTAPTKQEILDFHKRRATKRKGQPGYVTDQEAIEFEKRLKLLAPRR